MEGVWRAETAMESALEDSGAGLPVFPWALQNETWICYNDLRVKKSLLYVGNNLLSYLTAIFLGEKQ